MRKNKLLLLLALLMTAATGAWANWTGGTYTATSSETVGSITVSDDAKLTINEGATMYADAITINEGKTLTIVGPGSLMVYGVKGSDGQNGVAGINGSGCFIVKGNAKVTVNGSEGGQNVGGNGGNGGAATTCSVTIYSGTLILYGGCGGNGYNSGNGGDCFAGSGTLTYYGGNINTHYGVMGDKDNDNEGQDGDFGKAFASTYNVVFKNQPKSLTDVLGNPITVESIKSGIDVKIEGDGADPVPVTYAVKMANAETEAENANWTIASGSKSVKGSVADGLTGLEEGDAVTLTYSGRLKVKGVKATSDAAPAVKPAATLTEAPKPRDEYYVGDELLETLGTAEGGTLMYKLTTTNVKPTSTEGFSTENPKGVENPGGNWKNYIWYYIKGDDTHSDSEIFGPIELDVWDS